MRHILTFSLLLLTAITWAGNEKTIESSSRRRPKWYAGAEEGYIITLAEAQTLDQARDNAMAKVREQIVSAVATHVSASTNYQLNEVSENGVIQSTKSISNQIDIQAADIPYLSDISSSHIDAFYWAKIRRKDKSTYYQYAIRYPFTTSELRLLIRDYEARQKAINDTLQSFANVDFAHYSSVEEMTDVIKDIDLWSQTLPENDRRQKIVSTLRDNYRKMLKQLHIVLTEQDRSHVIVSLYYGQKKVACSTTPTVKSECLTDIRVENFNTEDVITFDFGHSCYEEEDNILIVSYLINGRKIKSQFIIR